MVSGSFISSLNQTVMAPILPAIMVDYGITPAIGQWLTTVFMLVNGLMIPVTAYLINRFTTRQLFFAAMSFFIAGTTVCALSSDFTTLIAGRVVQAVGAGNLLPLVSVNTMLLFPKERRGLALGITNVVMGVAPAFGPTFSGWIVDTLGWKYVFYGIAPLAAVVLIIALFTLRNLHVGKRAGLDWISVALSTLGFGGLLFGFSMAGNIGWDTPHTYIPIVAGVCVICCFVRRQLRSEQPLLKLSLLRNPVFSCAVSLSMICRLGQVVGMVITPIFLQTVAGYSATVSGMTVMPATAAMAAMNPVSGMLFDKYGPRRICIIGIASVAFGTFLMSLIDVDTPLAYIVFIYTFRMVGLSLCNMPLNTWGINALPNEWIAHGNAIVQTTTQIVNSIGTAILITIMMMVAGAYLAGGATETASMVRGVNAAYRFASILSFAGLIVAIFRVDRIKR
ncbi:MAG: multidrug efflux MFS transporter [Peptococcaceae bacterium]|nr:multidrug efflux MFS transporter [Peptococcaceae bacterium]